MPFSVLLAVLSKYGMTALKYWRQLLVVLAVVLLGWFALDCHRTKQQLADLQLRVKVAQTQNAALEAQQQGLTIKLALKDSEIVKARVSYTQAKQAATTHVVYVKTPTIQGDTGAPAQAAPDSQLVAVTIASLPEVQALEASCEAVQSTLTGKIALLEQDTLSKSIEIASIKSIAIIQTIPHPGVMERLGNAGSHALVGAVGVGVARLILGPQAFVIGAAVGAVIGVFHHE